MARNTQARRDELRTRLIDIAEAQIARDGLDTLRARDLAKTADCSVGQIYNVFEDLNGLIMAVNGRTFQALGAHVTAALDGQEATPQQQLIIMSHGYLDFATRNTQVWRALFDLKMSTDMRVPDWYLAELGKLFALIGAPIALIFPDWSRDRVDLMTRALFSSVHGIVLLGLERRISGVPHDQIREMIAVVLSNITEQSVS